MFDELLRSFEKHIFSRRLKQLASPYRKIDASLKVCEYVYRCVVRTHHPNLINETIAESILIPSHVQAEGISLTGRNNTSFKNQSTI